VPETTSGEADPTEIPEADPGADWVPSAPEPDASDVLPGAGVEAEADVDGGAAETAPTADVLAPAPANRDRSGSIRASAAAKAAAAAPATPKSGRATPKGGAAKQAPKPGRYTPPIPKEQRQSPRWFPGVLLGFLVLGLLTIVLNYVNVLPGGTNNWYLISGIVFIVVGLFMATFYH
jgi:hypothetical protein